MQASPRTKKALIIGCGIAGPATAIALQRIGVEPVIYEGHPAPRDEAGAFLNLAPNGVDVLKSLGVRDELIGPETPTSRLAFFNHRGRQLGGDPDAKPLLKRGPLTGALREAAVRRGVRIRFGKRLESVETLSGSGVSARFEDGTEAHGDLLVGCDGIRSRTRQEILPDAPAPAYTGIIDSGAVAHAPSLAPTNGEMRMTFGTRAFFGYQATASGEVYWFQNFHEPTEGGRGSLDALSDEEWRGKLLELHRVDEPRIAEIIAATDGPIGRWPIYDLPALPTWHRERAVLIGDAAHAMSPHAGQGASMALEDAVVLAKCLRDLPAAEGALAAFEGLRRNRVEKVVAEARRTGNQKAPSNALGRGLRDLLLPFFLKRGVRSARAATAYRVDWEATVA